MADSLMPEQSERDEIKNKWKDKPPAELLDAKVESDLYVKTLTARLDDLKKDYLELREKQQASEDLKTLIDQMKQRQQEPDTFQDTLKKPETPAIKPEDIEVLLEQKLSQKLSERDLVTKQKTNFDAVRTKLVEQYGTEYQTAYKRKIEELGLTPEFADDLAKNHPSLFLKSFELDSKPMSQSNSLPKSSFKQTSFTTPQTRNWAYYQEMKKSNPKMYLDPKIAVQMHDDAIALGDAFGMPE